MAKLFLSYDREDAGKAQEIASALEKAGHEVWWDRHIRGGAEYSEEIEQALDDADAVIVLWSTASVKSAWVRDEAAAGRDSGRLVPVLVEEIKPPMGFRQYQSVDLASWSPRRRSAQFDELLKATEELSGTPRHDPVPISTAATEARGRPRGRWNMLIVAAIAILLLGVLGAYWQLAGRSGPPTIAVTPSDSSAFSQSLARSLLVKLGQLQSGSANPVELLDDDASQSKADLTITVGGTKSGGHPRATVTLGSRRAGKILWSKDFEPPSGHETDLEEQIGIATARVLGCEMEESLGNSGSLNDKTRSVYLNACALSAELGWDQRQLLPMFREVLRSSPKFRPGWAQLLNAEANAVSVSRVADGPDPEFVTQLREDIQEARRVDPDMAEATLAELELIASPTISQMVAIVERAKSQDPDNPVVLTSRSAMLAAVGRMNDAVADAELAAQRDPLSPAVRSNYIYILAYSGRIDRARQELERAKQLWPGTQTIAETENSLELRFGDFEKAMNGLSGGFGPIRQLDINLHKDPSDANVNALVSSLKRSGLNMPAMVIIAQSLGTVNRADRFYEIVSDNRNADMLRPASYVLFRPWTLSLRKDPRFIQLAAQLGLVDYWRSSGRWPDFCSQPEIAYDCKAEAAKYAG